MLCDLKLKHCRLFIYLQLSKNLQERQFGALAVHALIITTGAPLRIEGRLGAFTLLKT